MKKIQSPIKNRVNGIFIPVKDVKKSKDWYCKILGLSSEGEIRNGHLYPLPMEGVSVILDEMPMWGGKEPSGPPTYETPAFMLQTYDIHASYQFMKDNDVELVTEIHDGRWFAFKDPDGNLLMICNE